VHSYLNIHKDTWVRQSFIRINDEIDRLLTFTLRDHAIQIWPFAARQLEDRMGVYVVHHKTLDELREVAIGLRGADIRWLPKGHPRIPSCIEPLWDTLDPSLHFILLEVVSFDGLSRDKAAYVPLDEQIMFGPAGIPALYNRITVDTELKVLEPVRFDGLAVKECSSCGNSVSKKVKCARCQRVRYCDSACQKQHWPQHKLVCSRAAAHSS
jgi:hypothetical protein